MSLPHALFAALYEARLSLSLSLSLSLEMKLLHYLTNSCINQDGLRCPVCSRINFSLALLITHTVFTLRSSECISTCEEERVLQCAEKSPAS